MTPGKQRTEHAIKQFYRHFKHEQACFLQAIQSTSSHVDCQRDAMFILTSLMFTYFLQKKGLLDGDADYLHHRLRQLHNQKSHRHISFLEFYQDVLRCLFHEVRSHKQLTPELEVLRGKLPSLNGHIFNRNSLEPSFFQLHIPDEAFERLFTFFDRYVWYLDPRPAYNDNEINPDVINYVFEQFMNQQGKPQGVYYTAEDITIYIASNTIIPRLLEAAEQQCPDAFRPHGPIWRLLEENPDRYIYEAIKKGCSVPLPPEIAAGKDNIAHRASWNTPLPQSFRNNALPTETWHELMARRQHYAELHARLSSGTVIAINDLITFNLNVQQFIQDVIESSDDVQVLWAFYCILTGTGQAASPNTTSSSCLRILDPTCGPGAFLLAAFNVLEPIYAACLQRMQHLLDEQETLSDQFHASVSPSSQLIIQEFHRCLSAIKQYPNRSFFILQSIIANNLYGIDLMPEAVELCHMRLFLKLVAHVDSLEHVKSLSTVDFNIHTGNALVSLTNRGGFEVIIGNPPYISSRTIDYSIPQDAMKFPNIYASILIHSLSLCTPHGRLSMIIPLSLLFSNDFRALRNLLITAGYSWFSSYDTMPAALFTGVNQRCTIWLAARSTESYLFVTPMYRWRSKARPTLLSRISYTALNDSDVASSGIPKLATLTQQHIFTKIKTASTLPTQNFHSQTGQGKAQIGFSQAARNFVSIFLEPPPCLDEHTLTPTSTSKISYLTLPSQEAAFASLALLAGDVYFWYWQVRGDGFDVTKWIIADFLAIMNAFSEPFMTQFVQLGQILHTRRFEALVFKKNAGKYVGNFNYRAVSHLTRRADLLLLLALEIERTEALELLYDVQRVLSINEQAGEKAIPDSIKSLFTMNPNLSIPEQNILAAIDTTLTNSYELTQEELDSILTMPGTSNR